jgi:23S rRNA (pseudouridine1915-N3)-methyltransferase
LRGAQGWVDRPRNLKRKVGRRGIEVKIVVIAVGAAKSPGLAAAIREYEARVSRYFKFEVMEVRGQRITARRSEADVIESDSEELLARVPQGLDVVAVDERGDSWSSEAHSG